jgi:hypothetical protein
MALSLPAYDTILRIFERPNLQAAGVQPGCIGNARANGLNQMTKLKPHTTAAAAEKAADRVGACRHVQEPEPESRFDTRLPLRLTLESKIKIHSTDFGRIINDSTNLNQRQMIAQKFST